MHDRSALLFITLFFFSLVAFLSPFHEYPIHDDWHYADAVRYLTETGELRVDPVVSPNLLLMVWYGFVSVALLSSFIGFFGALHLTTLLLAFFGLIFFYRWLRLLEVSSLASFFGTLVLLFNPTYLLFSFTFMTDVPFAAFMIFTLYTTTLWIKKNDSRFLYLALFFALCSFMIRQPGALFIVALLAYALLRKERLYLPVALGFILMILFMIYRRTVAPQSVAYASTFLPSIPSLVTDFIPTFVLFFFYLGFLLFPLLCSGFSFLAERNVRRYFLYALGFFGLVAGIFFVFIGKLMPYIGFTINTAGLGQIFFLAGEKVPIYPSFVWVIITLLSIFGAAFLAVFLYQTLLAWRKLDPAFLFLGLYLVVQFLLYLVIMQYDRYFLPFVILLVPFLVARLHFSLRLVAVGLILLAAFSVVGTDDYFLWNDARWNTLEEMVADGTPLEEINAGQEWAGWYFFWSHLAENRSPEATYLISFSVLKNTDVVSSIPYKSIDGTHQLYILRRKD